MARPKSADPLSEQAKTRLTTAERRGLDLLTERRGKRDAQLLRDLIIREVRAEGIAIEDLQLAVA